MGVKGQNHSKFMKIVTLPAKVLGKARDLYVKSMTGCAARASYGHSMPMTGQLPKSYSMGSSMSNNEADDFRELIRAASVRSLGHRNEIDMLLHQAKQASKPLPKSCSVGTGGFMGRIDEDKAEEDESVNAGKMASSELYPRSKSYAVGKTTVAF